jgi:hypothetical protein
MRIGCIPVDTQRITAAALLSMGADGIQKELRLFTPLDRGLTVLEILVHYTVLPRDFVITPIAMPDRLSIVDVPNDVLASGWDQPIPIATTQEYGGRWIAESWSAVPS